MTPVLTKILIVSSTDLSREVELVNRASISFNLTVVNHKFEGIAFTNKGYYKASDFISSFKKENSNSNSIIVVTDQKIENDCQLLTVENSIVISFFSILPGIFNFKSRAALIFIAGIYIDQKIKDAFLPSLSSSPEEDYFLEKINRVEENLYNLYSIQLLKILRGNVEVKNHFVLISHGIRTHAFWADKTKEELEKIGFECMVLRPELTTTIRFYLCLGRRNLYDYLIRKITEVQNSKPGYKISFVTHSYGSVLLANALLSSKYIHHHLNLENLILNGSIVPEKFDWNCFLDSSCSVKVNRVFNICGDRDYCPVFAKRFVCGTGYSGTFFFHQNSEKLLNIRLPQTGHSEMLTKMVRDKYWKNMLIDHGWKPETASCEVVGWLQFLERWTRIFSPRRNIFYILFIILIFLIN